MKAMRFISFRWNHINGSTDERQEGTLVRILFRSPWVVAEDTTYGGEHTTKLARLVAGVEEVRGVGQITLALGTREEYWVQGVGKTAISEEWQLSQVTSSLAECLKALAPH